MKTIFLAPVAAIAIAGAATGAYFWLTAEDTAEEAPLAHQEASLTPTPDATPAQEPTPTPTPPALAQPSPQPVPDDWLTYTDAETGVTLRYPPDWVVETRDPPVVPVPEVRFYKPVPNPPARTPSPDEIYFNQPASALVTLQVECCSDNSFQPPVCENGERMQLAGFPTDRCVYTKANPPPDGFTFSNIGAIIRYIVYSSRDDLHISIGLFSVDETGQLADTWDPEAAVEAERIVQSLHIAPPALEQPSPQPIPDDWLTYTDANTGVTLRYPPDWVAKKSVLSESSGLSTLAIYKPLPNAASPKPDSTHLPVSASVSLTDCCPPGFLDFYACDRPPEKTEVGAYPADRCVYTRDHPPPDGFNFPDIGAIILYTVKSPKGDLYFSVGLFTVDDTGTVILDTWNSEDAEEAERIVQTLEIAP